MNLLKSDEAGRNLDSRRMKKYVSGEQIFKSGVLEILEFFV